MHGSEGSGMAVWRSIFAADSDLCASAVGGDALRLHFLPKRGTGAGQRMDWGKREQWMIEITQSSSSQCNCVGMHLCLPWHKKSHLWSDMSSPRTPLKPRLSDGLKETGRNRWGGVNGMTGEWRKRNPGMKAIFINKGQSGSWRHDLVGLNWFAAVWFSAVPATYCKRLIRETLQKAGSSAWHIHHEQRSH